MIGINLPLNGVRNLKNKIVQKNIMILLFLMVILLACDRKTEKTRIGSFDVSQDGNKIIFSWYNNVSRSILEVDSNGKSAKELLVGSADTAYTNPRFNVDGTKIVFIGKAVNEAGYTSIYIANADGSGKKRLTFENDLISDVFYSSCDPKIYFVKSSSYGNYSPISEKGLHNSDLYSISLPERIIQRVTKQDAYNMYKPSEMNCDTLLMTISYPSLFGLTLIEKKNPNRLIKITPVNSPRQPNLYDSPIYSKSSGRLFFLAPYEMYTMDWKKREATMVIRDESMIENFRLIDGGKKIVYTNSIDNTFFVTDFEGKNLTKIKVGEK